MLAIIRQGLRISTKLSFATLLLIIAGSCNTGSRHSHNWAKSETVDLECLNDKKPLPYYEVLHGKVYLQSGSGKIYRINGKGGCDLVFDLCRHFNYQTFSDFIQHRDTTLDYLETDSLNQRFYLENFFLTDSLIYCALKVLVSTKGSYKKAEAIVHIFYPIILVLNRRNKQMVRGYSLHRPDSLSNDEVYINARLGFTVMGDSAIFRSFSSTKSLERKPELLKFALSRNFFPQVNRTSHFYSANAIRDNSYTTNRTFYYGEGRRYYCGTNGCVDLLKKERQELGGGFYGKHRVILYSKPEAGVINRSEVIVAAPASKPNSIYLYKQKEGKLDSLATGLNLGNIYAIEKLKGGEIWLICKEKNGDGYFIRKYYW